MGNSASTAAAAAATALEGGQVDDTASSSRRRSHPDTSERTTRDDNNPTTVDTSNGDNLDGSSRGAHPTEDTTTSSTGQEEQQQEGRNTATTTTTSSSLGRHGGGSRTNASVVVEEEYDLEEPLIAREEVRPVPAAVQEGEQEEPVESRWCNCNCNRCTSYFEDRCPRLYCICAYTWACIKYTSLPFCIALRARRTKVTLPLLCMSLILFITMMCLSGYKKNWTLNAGESRRVISSWLTKGIKVEVLNHHTTIEIDVYSLAGKKCPPLNGPKAIVHHPLENYKLQPGQFYYEYFYLNKGSTVSAGLNQYQGTSKVYVLEGLDKLKTIQKHSQSKDNDNNDDWLDKLLQSAIMSWTAKEFQQHVSANFRSIKNDVYTMVYDNPFQYNGYLLVDLLLQLTTYDLSHYTPICQDLAVHDCPMVPTKSFPSQCIILDAYGANDNGESFEEVPLKIVEYRNYSIIFLIALAPTVFAILWEFCNCFKAGIQSWRQGRERRRRPSTPPPTRRYEPPRSPPPPPPPPPPPTAPTASTTTNASTTSSATTRRRTTTRTTRLEPSAPPSSQDGDEETIPLVKAEVVSSVAKNEDSPGNPFAAEASAEASAESASSAGGGCGCAANDTTNQRESADV